MVIGREREREREREKEREREREREKGYKGGLVHPAFGSYTFEVVVAAVTAGLLGSRGEG